MIVIRSAAVLVALVLAAAGFSGTTSGQPAAPKKAPVETVTLVGSPVTVATPGELYDVSFAPDSAVSFTQQPGEVLSVSMIATVTSGDDSLLFCDVHAAVQLTGVDSADTPIVMHQTVILAQRGDDWWRMAEVSRDLTRTVPAPATATTHTIVGKVWMDPPPEEDPDCYGIEAGGQYQEFTVPVRVSIVTIAGS